MIDCKTTFELYDSHALATTPYSLINYGETRAISGVRRSLESTHTGRLTYIEGNTKIKEAYITEDEIIQKDTVLLV